MLEMQQQHSLHSRCLSNPSSVRRRRVTKELFSTRALALPTPATAALSRIHEVHVYVQPRDRLSSSSSVVFASAEKNTSRASVITFASDGVTVKNQVSAQQT